MKTLMKRTLLILFSALFSLCCFFLAGETLQGGSVKANADAETQLTDADDALSFESISEVWNNDTNGYFIVKFNVNEWAQAAIPTNYSGITYNGKDISDLVVAGGLKFYLEHSLWFTYKPNNEKLSANYNGYSHPTIAIEEGATVVYNGKTYTFHAVTFYLNLETAKWQTEVPAEYGIAEPTSFVGIDESTTKDAIVLQYEDELVWSDSVGNLADHILLDGATNLKADESVTVNPTDKTITVNLKGEYNKFSITVGGKTAGVIVPAVTLYATETGWSFDPQLVNTLTGVGVFGNNNLLQINGACHTVLGFSEFFIIGGDNSVNDVTNMAASTDYDLATKATFDGKTFHELYQENPLFYIGYMSGGKYLTFQIPQAYLNAMPENGETYHTIEIEAGAEYMDMILPKVSLINFDNVWLNNENFNPEPLAYSGIAYGWNCMRNGMYIDTILQFGVYDKDFLGADNGTVSHASPENLAGFANEPIANKLTINGVPVKDISGVTVSYAHGYNYLYISVPMYELSSNEEYRCVELHLADRTVFKNSVLSEVSLYLINGQWTEEKPTTIPTDADGTYFTAKDIFNGKSGGYYKDGVYALSKENYTEKVNSAKTADSMSAIYNFLYKSNSIDFDYSLLTGVGNGFGGVRLMIYRNEGESLQGFNLFINGAFAGAKQMGFELDQWYAVRLSTAIADGKIIVSVAFEGVEIIHAEVAYDGAMGNDIQLKKSYGAVDFADFKAGDIKQPTINWQGKAVYNYVEGDAKPDDAKFMGVISVTDNYDKANFSAGDITVVWEDGAVQDGKLQAGDWTITFLVSDRAGNTASYSVMASVAVSDKITVIFNTDGVTSSAVYTKGALINQPADPEKSSDAEKNYFFDGWYLGDKKWDFANDCTFENIELVAVFAIEYKEYTVSITSEGLDKGYTYTLKMRLGSTLDSSILAREGYTFILTEDGKKINNIKVDGDMQIQAVYTKNTEEDSGTDSAPGDSDSSNDSSDTSSNTSEKSGCKGSIDTTLITLGLAFVASAFVFVKSSTKVGKEDE